MSKSYLCSMIWLQLTECKVLNSIVSLMQDYRAASVTEPPNVVTEGDKKKLSKRRRQHLLRMPEFFNEIENPQGFLNTSFTQMKRFFSKDLFNNTGM